MVPWLSFSIARDTGHVIQNVTYGLNPVITCLGFLSILQALLQPLLHVSSFLHSMSSAPTRTRREERHFYISLAANHLTIVPRKKISTISLPIFKLESYSLNVSTLLPMTIIVENVCARSMELLLRSRLLSIASLK